MYNVATIYEEVYNTITDNHTDDLKAKNISVKLVQLTTCEDKVYPEVETLISGKYDEAIAKVFPNIISIIVPYTGLNGLDMGLLKSKSIQVSNSSAHGKFVAERALALTLAILGKIVYFNDNMRQGDWSKRMEADRVSWHTLSHKKVGIYGYGVIGRIVHKLMTPFEPLIGVISYKDKVFEGCQIFESLESLATWSDVLIVAAPLNEETEKSIDCQVFEALENSVLINVGRGKIIDEEALYNAIKSKKLYGFASDVWFQYPTKDKKNLKPSKYDIETYDNVIMTPHNAGFEASSLKLRCEDVVNQIIDYVKNN